MNRLVLLAALALTSGIACGQLAFTHWTAEALASQSQFVFKGVVTDVRLPVPDSGGSVSFTVEVHSVLKGSPGKAVTLGGYDRDQYRAWKNAGTELLWFDSGDNEIKPLDPASHVRGMVSAQMYGNWMAFDLAPGSVPNLLGMDLHPLKTPADMLRVVSRFLSKHKEPAPLINLIVPNVLIDEIGGSNGSERLVWPIVPELEAKLWDVVRSPKSVLPPKHSDADETFIRQNCVRALCFFKSDRNIRRMKALLSDTGKGMFGHVPFTSADTPDSEHWVSFAAADVLAFWGVATSIPEKSRLQ